MALSATGVFEVDVGHASTSDSLNAGYYNPAQVGAGTDRSITSPIACTDLVIDGSDSTKVSSASIGFTSDHNGMGLRITAGTGFTASLREILSVSAGVAQLDASAGTVGSTGGTARVGGPLASPGNAMGLSVAGNTIFVRYQATVYAITSSTINVANGRIQWANATSATTGKLMVGYDSNRTTTNSDANRPILEAQINSIQIANIPNGQYGSMRNFVFDGDNRTGITGFFGGGGTESVGNLKAVDCITGFGSNAGTLFQDCEAEGGTTGFSLSATTRNRIRSCVVKNVSGTAISSGGAGGTITRCLISGCSAGITVNNISHIDFCTIYNAIAQGISIGTSAGVTVTNSIISTYRTGGSGYGIETSAATIPIWFENNAFFNPTTHNVDTTNQLASTYRNLLSLTADPFTNAVAGDFSLNNAAGGGAVCRGAGSNGCDLGAYQSAGGGGASYFLF